MIQKQRELGLVYLVNEVWVRPESIVMMKPVTRGFFKVRLYTRLYFASGEKLLVKDNIYAVHNRLTEGLAM